MNAADREQQPSRSMAVAILTDVHFWVPFAVLLLGIGVLVLCARSR